MLPSPTKRRVMSLVESSRQEPIEHCFVFRRHLSHGVLTLFGGGIRDEYIGQACVVAGVVLGPDLGCDCGVDSFEGLGQSDQSRDVRGRRHGIGTSQARQERRRAPIVGFRGERACREVQASARCGIPPPDKSRRTFSGATPSR